MNLLDHVQVNRALAPASAATTTLNGTVIDRANFNGVSFVITLGDITDTSVLTLKAQESDSSDTATFVDIPGATTDAFTAGASNADNKNLQLDVYRAKKRYVRCVLTRGTANAVVESGIAILHSGRALETAAGDDCIARTCMSPEYS